VPAAAIAEVQSAGGSSSIMVTTGSRATRNRRSRSRFSLCDWPVHHTDQNEMPCTWSELQLYGHRMKKLVAVLALAFAVPSGKRYLRK